MRRWTIALGVVGSLVVLVLLGSFALIESEEVVVIVTRDADGETHRARVWTVEHGGVPWVAPGNRSNGWFQRLLENPEVAITKDGATTCYRATAVEGPQAIEVLQKFLDKYAAVIRATSILNRLLEPAGDDSDPVAVRLAPCS